MKQFILICICLVLASCSTHSNGLVGTWKSDAIKTLASLNQINEIDPKAKKLLEDDFFGHLVVEYKENEARAYFDDCIEKYSESVCDQMMEFSPYKLIKETKEYFVISYFDEILDSNETKKFIKEGNCYYSVISEKVPVKEYFCKEQ